MITGVTNCATLQSNLFIYFNSIAGTKPMKKKKNSIN